MKIGIFTDDFYPIIGGMGAHIYNLSNKLKELSNIELFIFSSAKNKIKNHKTIFPFSRKFGKNIALSFYLNLILPKLIEQYSLDAVHIHSGAGGIFLLRELKVPCIVTAHTNNYLCQYHYLKKISKLILSPLEKSTYFYANKIIAVSSLIKENLIKFYKISKNKICVVPNGVDISIFKKIKSVKKLENSLLFVGRLDKRKGVEFLIRTIPFIKRRVPNIKLFILGEGPKKHKLINLIKELNLKKNIVFKGFVKEKEVAKYYNLCEICIVPSIIEGFGLNILEALSCNTPVISTKEVGATKDINDKKNKIPTVNYGDCDRLSKKIISFLKNKKVPSFPDINFIKKEYCWNKIAKKTIEVYNNEKD